MRRHFVLSVGWVLLLATAVRGADVSRVSADGKTPADSRLKAARTLSDAYHPWQPADSKEGWEQQAAQLRQRILVSQGLWPLPPKTPLNPVIHGKIEHEDYTIEKVFFASRPGQYVTGSLYRPRTTATKLPGVLCPHGHWANGRFYDAGDKAAQEQIQQQGEKFDCGAHSPLQARMVNLARMGCIVFHYDMVGYADNQPLAHRSDFSDAEAELRLQNIMGLQTWNSLRSLDFLLSIPEVDPTRVAVTGASGGGTQTFILCAIDPRPTVAFPAVMVSTAMQGGCVCENASYLRIGVNNIAFAACFAPRPMAMSGANDWTIDIETKGLPELKQIYGLYGQGDLVQAKCYPQFGHNYNQVAREMMYAWLNQHLGLNQTEKLAEKEFAVHTPQELSVFDAAHPVPADALRPAQLRRVLTDESRAVWQGLLPRTQDQLADYQAVVRGAAEILLDGGLPTAEQVESSPAAEEIKTDAYAMHKVFLSRTGAGEQIPFVAIVPKGADGQVVLWVDGKGKQALFDDAGQPTPAVQSLLKAGRTVCSIDPFQTGEYLPAGESYEPKVNETFAGYTFGYNRPLIADRVRDILTTVAAIRKHPACTELDLVGSGDAGLWVALAGGMAGGSVRQTFADLGNRGFEQVTNLRDPQLLPGALKYGGVGGLATLALPSKLTLSGTTGLADEEIQPLMYAAAFTDKVKLLPESQNAQQLASLALGTATSK